MKSHLKHIAFVWLALMMGCEPTVETTDITAGDADFNSYVAIGSTFTSGFADGALSKYGQRASYPNLIAERMQRAGGGAFNIPLLLGELGTFPDYDVTRPERYTLTLPRLELINEPDCKGEVNLAPERVADLGDNEIDLDDPSQRIAAPGKVFHLLGIPAMKAVHFILPGFGDVSNYTNNLPFSPYYWRFATDPQTSVLMDEMKAANPTFFTCEIGMGDVSNYATDGGIGDINGQDDEDLTSATVFRASLELILDSLLASGAQGVVANIPDIMNFPHFTRIEYDLLEMDAAEAAEANTRWAAEGLTFIEGDNPFVIQEDGDIRQIRPTEKILLGIPIDSLKCHRWGDSIPIPDKYILADDEIANINTFTAEFNTIIAEEAAERNLTLVDLHSFMQDIEDEATFSGIDMTTEFVSGGFFSLDGLHPTPRGQALLANEFIDAINATYGSTLPRYQVADFDGVVFP